MFTFRYVIVNNQKKIINNNNNNNNNKSVRYYKRANATPRRSITETAQERKEYK
jgi:hypothetical protein